MKKILLAIFVIITVVAMTIVSLLPHHHHCDTDAICFVMNQCSHSDNCNSDNHKQDNSDDTEHCSLHEIDLSASKQGDSQFNFIAFSLSLPPDITILSTQSTDKNKEKSYYYLKFLSYCGKSLHLLRAPPVAQ